MTTALNNKILSDITNQIADIIIRESRFPLSEEKRELWWEVFVRRILPYQKDFEERLIKLFKEQKREIFKNIDNEYSLGDTISNAFIIPNRKVRLDDWNFDKEEWITRFRLEGDEILSDTMEDMGQQQLNALVTEANFDVESPRVREYLQKRTFKFSGDVNDTTYEAVRKELTEGVASGESVWKLKKRIESVFTDATSKRAAMIAQNEVVRASNAGAEEAYIQSGVVTGKEWLTARDEKVCPFCNGMNGTVVQLEQNFFDQGDRYEVPIGERTLALNLGYEDIKHPPLHPK